MRAAVVDSSGAPGDRIRFVVDHPTPRSASDALLVRTLAAGLNPLDYKLPEMAARWFRNGRIVCFDICGEVMETGHGYKKGDIVYGLAENGALAEYVNVDPTMVALKPPNVPVVEAAGFGVAYFSALLACNTAKVQKGSHVAVLGASGGCGTAAVQIARALGATSVFGICSRKNTDTVAERGATSVICYDEYAKPTDITAAIPNGSLDGIVDTVSSREDINYEPICRPWLRPDGMYAALNTPNTGDLFRTLLRLPTWCHRDGYRFVLLRAKDTKGSFSQMTEWLASGKLRVPVHSVHPFTAEGVAAAFEAQRSRRATGKVIVAVDPAACEIGGSK